MNNHCAVDEPQPQGNELALLSKRKEILRLEQEIRRLELELGGMCIARKPVRLVHFVDIEPAIPKFSGADRTHSVHDFLRQMEDVLEHVAADDVLRMLTLRSSVTGDARFLLTSGAVTYTQMKSALLKEYGGRKVYDSVIYSLLDGRKWKPTESKRRFVMEMEAIARRGQVSEKDLIVSIRNGFSEHKEYFMLFARCVSMADVKEAVDTCERVCERH